MYYYDSLSSFYFSSHSDLNEVDTDRHMDKKNIFK